MLCVLLSRHRRTIQLHTSVISTSNASLLSRYSCQGSIRIGLILNKTHTAKSAPASWASAKSREPLSALKAGSNWSAKFWSIRSHWIKEWSRSRLKDRPLDPRLISSHLMSHWNTYRSSSELPVARDRICSHSTMRSGLLYIYSRADNIAFLCIQWGVGKTSSLPHPPNHSEMYGHLCLQPRTTLAKMEAKITTQYDPKLMYCLHLRVQRWRSSIWSLSWDFVPST